MRDLNSQLKQLCNCKPDSSYRTHATRQRMLN